MKSVLAYFLSCLSLTAALSTSEWYTVQVKKTNAAYVSPTNFFLAVTNATWLVASNAAFNATNGWPWGAGGGTDYVTNTAGAATNLTVYEDFALPGYGAVVGYVWTVTNVNGRGYWAAAPGAAGGIDGTNDNLENITVTGTAALAWGTELAGLGTGLTNGSGEQFASTNAALKASADATNALAMAATNTFLLLSDTNAMAAAGTNVAAHQANIATNALASAASNLWQAVDAELTTWSTNELGIMEPSAGQVLSFVAEGYWTNQEPVNVWDVQYGTPNGTNWAAITTNAVLDRINEVTNTALIATTADLNAASNALHLDLTNEVAAVAANTTNYAASVGANATNHVLLISTNAAITVLSSNLYKTIWIDAGAMAPSTTNGAAMTTNAVAGSENRTMDGYAFDDSTSESVQFKLALDNWDTNGWMKAKFYCTTASAAGTNVWGIAMHALTHDDALSVAFGTEVTVSNVVTAANDMLVSVATAQITCTGSPYIGDMLGFKIRRVVGGTGQWMSGDMVLLGVQLQYKEKIANTVW